jgi:hypothetical protein
MGGFGQMKKQASAFTALVAVFALTMQSAWAATVPINEAVLQAGQTTVWEPYTEGTPCGGPGSGDAYIPVEDGVYGGGGQDSDFKSDAFDYGLMVQIGATPFADADDNGSTGPNSFTVGPRNVEDLRITTTATGLVSSRTLRYLVSLRNPSGSPISRVFTLDSDLGSDIQTNPRESSSGDDSFTETDRWVVTSDNATAPSDPPVTHVLFGKRAREKVTDVVENATAGNNCLTVEYELRIPRRSTRYMLFFAEMADSNEAAIASAAKFNKRELNRKLLTGLSASVRANVLNFDLG